MFQETILLVDNLERKEDDRLLRFLLESGDISGLTVVLLGDSTACECDLEFNEDPQNLLAGHLPTSADGRKPPGLESGERIAAGAHRRHRRPGPGGDRPPACHPR